MMIFSVLTMKEISLRVTVLYVRYMLHLMYFGVEHIMDLLSWFFSDFQRCKISLQYFWPIGMLVFIFYIHWNGEHWCRFLLDLAARWLADGRAHHFPWYHLNCKSIWRRNELTCFVSSWMIEFNMISFFDQDHFLIWLFNRVIVRAH